MEPARSMLSIRDRAHALVGTTVRQKWTLDGLLGLGGTAAVFSATHRNGARAALKLLRQELCGFPEVVQRFVREGYVANRIGHPGVVSVLDDDTTEEGAPFLVMELLEGESLERYTKGSAHRLPFPTTLHVVDQLLEVLIAAHAKGVLHRDIKPANIFLTTDGRVKVLDFGIARLAEGHDGATQTGTTIGTPGYMPPEQARGRWQQVDARTDVWAAGATAFALLTGMRPRRADTANEELLLAMTAPVPSVRTLLPHLDPALAHVVDSAMAFEMEQRYPSATAMLGAFRDAVSRLPYDASAGTLQPIGRHDSGFPQHPSGQTGPSWGNEAARAVPAQGGFAPPAGAHAGVSPGGLPSSSAGSNPALVGGAASPSWSHSHARAMEGSAPQLGDSQVSQTGMGAHGVQVVQPKRSKAPWVIGLGFLTATLVAAAVAAPRLRATLSRSNPPENVQATGNVAPTLDGTAATGATGAAAPQLTPPVDLLPGAPGPSGAPDPASGAPAALGKTAPNPTAPSAAASAVASTTNRPKSGTASGNAAGSSGAGASGGRPAPQPTTKSTDPFDKRF